MNTLPAWAACCRLGRPTWLDGGIGIDPPAARDLKGDEPFAGLDATVLDFWRFAMNDLRTNNVRGYLTEFMVARAVGATGARVEWDPWDVAAPDETKIEVKSSGYLQSWEQRKLSAATFRVADVAPRSVVGARVGARMGLATLKRIAGEPGLYDDLRASVHAAAADSSG